MPRREKMGGLASNDVHEVMSISILSQVKTQNVLRGKRPVPHQ